MDNIQLIPKTAKAKQLIKKYGNIWYIKLDNKTDIIVVPLEQINPKRPYSRWINVYEDEHFKIERK